MRPRLAHPASYHRPEQVPEPRRLEPDVRRELHEQLQRLQDLLFAEQRLLELRHQLSADLYADPEPQQGQRGQQLLQERDHPQGQEDILLLQREEQHYHQE